MVIAMLLFFIHSIIKKTEHKKIVAQNIKSIPEFCIYNVDETEFCSRYISQESSCLFVFFNPDCDHCKYEAEQITVNIESFRNHQIFFISSSSVNDIKEFAIRYFLNDYDNIKFLCDKDYVVQNLMGVNLIPSSYIYNSSHHLVKSFRGEVKIEALIKYLKM